MSSKYKHNTQTDLHSHTGHSATKKKGIGTSRNKKGNQSESFLKYGTTNKNAKSYQNKAFKKKAIKNPKALMQHIAQPEEAYSNNNKVSYYQYESPK